MMYRKIFRLILVFCGGFVLAKGNIQLTKNRRLDNPHGRITGIMMLIAGISGGFILIAGVLGALLYSLLNLTSSDRVQRF